MSENNNTTAEIQKEKNKIYEKFQNFIAVIKNKTVETYEIFLTKSERFIQQVPFVENTKNKITEFFHMITGKETIAELSNKIAALNERIDALYNKINALKK
ncbi:MAG: hypothetical protein HQK76_09610 [Desulfobacterales bacterium]|nr:hypothetical protein [Desulfobacterales bacterium]